MIECSTPESVTWPARTTSLLRALRNPPRSAMLKSTHGWQDLPTQGVFVLRLGACNLVDDVLLLGLQDTIPSRMRHVRFLPIGWKIFLPAGQYVSCGLATQCPQYPPGASPTGLPTLAMPPLCICSRPGVGTWGKGGVSLSLPFAGWKLRLNARPGHGASHNFAFSRQTWTFGRICPPKPPSVGKQRTKRYPTCLACPHRPGLMQTLCISKNVRELRESSFCSRRHLPRRKQGRRSSQNCRPCAKEGRYGRPHSRT